jgi:hypothetical protein
MVGGTTGDIRKSAALLSAKPPKEALGRRPMDIFFYWVVGSCVESQPMMTPDNAEAIIVFLFYCLAVHVTQQERRKRG